MAPLIRATRNLTSDRLRKDIKKNSLIMGETAEVSEDNAKWLKERGYAEDVTDQMPADQDGASNAVVKAAKPKKGDVPVGSVDVDAEEADEKAASKAHKAAAGKK